MSDGICDRCGNPGMLSQRYCDCGGRFKAAPKSTSDTSFKTYRQQPAVSYRFDDLQRDIKSFNDDKKIAAIQSLKDTRDDRAAVILAVALDDIDPHIRLMAMDALASIGTGSARYHLIRSFEREYQFMISQRVADIGIGIFDVLSSGWKSAAVGSFLRAGQAQSAADRYEFFSIRLLQILSSMGNSALPELRTGLFGETQRIRQRVIMTLAVIGTQEAAELLERVRNDSDSTIVEAYRLAKSMMEESRNDIPAKPQEIAPPPPPKEFPSLSYEARREYRICERCGKESQSSERYCSCGGKMMVDTSISPSGRTVDQSSSKVPPQSSMTHFDTTVSKRVCDRCGKESSASERYCSCGGRMIPSR